MSSLVKIDEDRDPPVRTDVWYDALSTNPNASPAWMWFAAAAMFVQSLFGVPWPKKVGCIEATTGTLLFLSCLLTLTKNGLFQYYKFQKVTIISWAIILIVPLLVGVFNNSDQLQISRDVVPVLFWSLPIIYFFSEIELTDKNSLANYASLCGGIESVRLLLSVGCSFSGVRVGIEKHISVLSLSYDPFIHFSGIYALCSLLLLPATKARKNIIFGTFLASVLILSFTVQLLFFQRLPLVLMLCSGIFTCLLNRRIINSIVLNYLGMSMLLFIVLCPVICYDAIKSFLGKTIVYGMNNKDAELWTVVRAVGSSPKSILVGYGWGAKFSDPIFFGEQVGFTHSLITYVLFKTGFLGIGACVIGFWSIFSINNAFAMWLPAMTGATATILIAVLAQATYKTHAFGWILVIFFAHLTQGSRSTTLSLGRATA